MLLVADVHGANDALARVASLGETLLVLGDLLNLIDYRTMDGLLAEVAGSGLVGDLAELRERGDIAEMSRRWRAFSDGREQELREFYDRRITESYLETRAALEGSNAYVTFGNADRPNLLREMLPEGVRFVDAEVVEIEGWSVGFAGGGMESLGVPGEVGEAEMAAKLDGLGRVDILCTHVAPAVPQLSHDVVGGPIKESGAVLQYLLEFKPRWHYFGDIHQPQAVAWRVGETLSRNVGYFRATGRPVRHNG
jgi:Icc-related predicted phosphoesterase